MSGSILRRAALLSLVLLCVTVDSPAPARAAQNDPPQTMQGVYRYRVRGLTAAAGLFTGMFKVQGMYHAAAHRILPGFLKILSGMAQVSNDPSTKEVHDFLRSGDLFGVDLSTIPIAAGFGVEIEFTLELVKKEWQLKRGSYRWSSDHHFSFSAGDGSLTENVRGQGSGVLDPKTSSITLVTTGKKGSRRLELSGDVPITQGFTAGKSVFTNGPIRWAFDHGNGAIEIVFGPLASIRDKLGDPGENYSVGHISFGKSGSPTKGGPPGRVMKDSAVYQDLLDSGVFEEWELYTECEATLDSPADEDELVYDLAQPGRIENLAVAVVTPSFWENDLLWLLPEISESELWPSREEARGNRLDFSYTELPEKNSAFGFRQVVAEFGDRAKAAGCKNPELANVGFFFSRRGLNHGGTAGPKSPANPDKTSPNPNWFHYWMQTKANVGLPGHFVRWGGNDKGCRTEGVEAYYRSRADHIVMCDLIDFDGYNPLAFGYKPNGIDWFAQLLLHERQHYANYQEWWARNPDRSRDRDPIDPKTKKETAGDNIPDDLEPSVPVPPEIFSRSGAKFDPEMQDSFGYGLEDEHYLAWAAALRWSDGTADAEDWSCPGKQGRTLCSD